MNEEIKSYYEKELTYIDDDTANVPKPLEIEIYKYLCDGLIWNNTDDFYRISCYFKPTIDTILKIANDITKYVYVKYEEMRNIDKFEVNIFPLSLIIYASSINICTSTIDNNGKYTNEKTSISQIKYSITGRNGHSKDMVQSIVDGSPFIMISGILSKDVTSLCENCSLQLSMINGRVDYSLFSKRFNHINLTRKYDKYISCSDCIEFIKDKLAMMLSDIEKRVQLSFVEKPNICSDIINYLAITVEHKYRISYPNGISSTNYIPKMTFIFPLSMFYDDRELTDYGKVTNIILNLTITDYTKIDDDSSPYYDLTIECNIKDTEFVSRTDFISKAIFVKYKNNDFDQ